MPNYYSRIINPFFIKNQVYWALYFYILGTKESHFTKWVNDFCEFIGLTEDDYPRQSLLRKFHDTRHFFFKNNKELWQEIDNNYVNGIMFGYWIELTFTSYVFGSKDNFTEDIFYDFIKEINTPDHFKEDILSQIKAISESL